MVQNKVEGEANKGQTDEQAMVDKGLFQAYFHLLPEALSFS